MMDSWTERTTDADRVRVFHGDSRAVLKAFPDAHFDSVVCDPPYALVSVVQRFGNSPRNEKTENMENPYGRTGRGFMGMKWDTGETAFAVEFWAEVWRVLKPGGHVIAFSGTRTYHRLACAVEDAGFEIRDMVAWLYGSGFPKSHDVSKGIDKAAGASREVTGVAYQAQKMNGGAYGSDRTERESTDVLLTAPATDAARQWQGWGTALKPALEPVVLARKPLDSTVAANVLQHGTGALNIDASRIGMSAEDASAIERMGGFGRQGYSRPKTAETFMQGTPLASQATAHEKGRWPANVLTDGSEEVTGAFPETSSGGYPPAGGMRSHGDVYGKPNERGEAVFGGSDGSAARFFYSAKADAEDRLGSRHPTVKPVDLMAYLVRLVTPPGGLTLDPFAGSGTTGVGAMRGGFRAVLIEREDAYVEDIVRKLAWARGEGALTSIEMAKLDTPEAQAKAAGADLPLFG